MILEILSAMKDDGSLDSRLARNERLLKAANIQFFQDKERLTTLLASESDYPIKFLFNQAVEQLEQDVAALEHRVSSLNQETELLREPEVSDISYRKRIVKEFPRLLKERFGGTDFKFHGTSLVNALAILESGKLVSSPELGHGRTSFDITGQVSATDVSSVGLSIKDYLNIKDIFLPMGCLFVLDTEAAGYGYIESLELISHGAVSAKFKGILCTPEVLPIIREQLSNFGYTADLATDFFEFVS